VIEVKNGHVVIHKKYIHKKCGLSKNLKDHMIWRPPKPEVTLSQHTVECAMPTASLALHRRPLVWTMKSLYYYNPLGNLNSGLRPWAKLIRSASLQRVFDAAIAKLLCRLVCFYQSICVCFYDNVELRLMRCISKKRLSTVARWRHGKVFNCYVRCLYTIR